MRFPFVLIAGLAAGTLVAAPVRSLLAQDRDDSVSDRPGRFERQLEQPDRLMRIVMSRRARLGIKVNLQARNTDSLGAYVESVLPNGPAAKAGLRSGDVITKLGGKSVLAGGRAEQDGDQGQSLPGLRLIELAAKLEPADTVAVEFLRGRDRRTVSIVTENEPDMFSMRLPPPGRPHDDMRMPVGDFFEMGPGDRFEFLAGSPLGDLELAPLNSDLGAYFGTTDGVLVIRAPKGGSLGLKGGDVVQAVDGRKPAGPSHLMRILRSYDGGETFKLDILRNRKRETVTAHLGEREH